MLSYIARHVSEVIPPHVVDTMDVLSTDILLLGLPGDVRCAYSRLGLHQASDVRANAEMCSSVTGFPAPPVATPAQGQGKREK